MQFYIVDPSPTTNAKRLPDYALRVNMREGWQILSDIGHRFGVTWENQNKCYNKHHPWTRQFSHKGNLNQLVYHLRACCEELYNRTGKIYGWYGWVEDFYTGENEELFLSLPRDQYEETIHYLETAKRDKLEKEEWDFKEHSIQRAR